MAVTLLEQHVHSVLLIPIVSAAVCLLLEVHFRDHPILVLFRISMFLTQGTWFWQVCSDVCRCGAVLDLIHDLHVPNSRNVVWQVCSVYVCRGGAVIVCLICGIAYGAQRYSSFQGNPCNTPRGWDDVPLFL